MSDESKNLEGETESKAKHHYRMRHDWKNLIDDLIEEGQAQGVFDDLPGKGKPLNLKKNPYAPELDLAFGLLKHNDLKPAWITARQEVQVQMKALRADIKRQWLLHEREYRLAQGAGQRDSLSLSWDDACRRWTGEIGKLNRQIEQFNLKRPSNNLEIFKLGLEDELERLGARRWLRDL